MKNTLFIFFILLTNFFVRGQVSSYTFSETTGTYSAIVGGTQLVTTTAGATSYDTDGSYFTLPVGSQFTFNGVTITSINMTADGSIYLNPGTTTTGNGTTGSISSTATASGIICGMNMDLRSTSLATQVYERRWQDVGTEVVFQWQNAARFLSDATERFSFQIRVTKSTGVIKIVYGNMTTIANSTTYVPMVGLRGTGNTDFNNRRLTGTVPDATPNWGAPNGTTAGTSNAHTVRFTSAASCFPVSGLTFIWTPPSCIAPTSLIISYTSPTSANLSWVASSSAPSSGYEWEIRTSGVGGSGATGLVANGTTAAGVVSTTVSTLTQNTTYTLYVRSNCGGTFSSWAASASSTSPVPAPSNDNCSGATLLPCGTSGLAGTTVGTVSETAPLGYSSPYGVWYSFVGDGQSTTISTVAGTGFDHEMLIMSGTTCGATYTLVTDQDVGLSGGSETYTFTSTIGTQYYVYIAYYSTTGLSTNTGTFTMTRTCTAPPTPPVNDNCSGATLITTPYNSGVVSTANATSDVPTATSACSTFGYNVWYRVVGNNSTMTASTCNVGTNFDTEVRVYRGSCGSMVEEICNDDDGVCSFSTLRSTVSWCSLNGENYYISVGYYTNTLGTGNFELTVTSGSLCSALPVELLYFEGTGNRTFNSLKWSTASEHNSDYFLLERSVDGEQWDYVGTTKAMGNSTQVVDYLYVDNFVSNGYVYYNLKQVDYDGNFKMYGPISIYNDNTIKKVVKYVNLIGQEINLDTKGFMFEVYEDGSTKKIIR